jgi:hypothetical protein
MLALDHRIQEVRGADHHTAHLRRRDTACSEHCPDCSRDAPCHISGRARLDRGQHQRTAQQRRIGVCPADINANPADSANHPYGVWTLPPVLRTSPPGEPADPDFDSAPYLAIGESDRMTLLFRKPKSDGPVPAISGQPVLPPSGTALPPSSSEDEAGNADVVRPPSP